MRARCFRSWALLLGAVLAGGCTAGDQAGPGGTASGAAATVAITTTNANPTTAEFTTSLLFNPSGDVQFLEGLSQEMSDSLEGLSQEEAVEWGTRRGYVVAVYTQGQGQGIEDVGLLRLNLWVDDAGIVVVAEGG